MPCDTHEEVWKDIPGFEGSYQASSLGRVRSLARHVGAKGGALRFNRGRVLSQCNMGRYKGVVLSVSGGKQTLSVHRLVCMAFRPMGCTRPTMTGMDQTMPRRTCDGRLRQRIAPTESVMGGKSTGSGLIPQSLPLLMLRKSKRSEPPGLCRRKLLRSSACMSLAFTKCFAGIRGSD